MTAKELQDKISNVTSGIAGDGATRFNYYAGYTNGDGNFGRWSEPSSEDVKTRISSLDLDPKEYSIGKGRYNFSKALDDARTKLTDLKIEEQISGRIDPIISKEKQYDTLAEQIAALTGGGQQASASGDGTGAQNTLVGLSADRNYGASDLASKLNFQVSDQQILDDYNNSKISRLNSVVDRGNTQIAGIQERLSTAQGLLDQLPSDDARRKSSEVYVNQLKSDLTSVQGAVTDATNQIKDFKPIAYGSPEASSQITSFREYLQLPEEKATQQLRQIDPESYKTAIGLGRQYRQMATQPLGATTTQQTEDIRNTIEQEALNQLRLGSTLGAEERRGYEQAARAAQTARGNVFGLGPAVQEAAQIGAAGEARKLARYGAAQSFLGSGETTGAAASRDLALREGLQQNRLGAAANFIGGGPSLYNLAQARTTAQQNQFQNYINANQAQPGQFGQTPSTAANFYQAVDQQIPVQLTNAFNQLYNSQADYQASTYGAQVGAQAATYTSPSRAFGNIASGLSGFTGLFGGPGSKAFFRG